MTSNQEDMLNYGIAFMRTIINEHGSEKGVEMWNVISSQLGDEFKTNVFMSAVIGGQSSASVTVTIPDSCTTSKVEFIKTIRHFTGYGLKEAMDIMIGIASNPTIRIPDFTKKREFMIAMQHLGASAS